MQQTWVDFMEADTALIFRSALRAVGLRPTKLRFAARALSTQRAAARTRAAQRDAGLVVPPLLIVSVTKNCNLRCAGCYDKSRQPLPGKEMSTQTLEAVLAEAQSLGTGVILFAGGEPLVRRDLYSVIRRFPKLTFLVFTNGTMLNDASCAELRRSGNTLPVISLEGGKAATDTRRGIGQWSRIEAGIAGLKKWRVPFGHSITVDSRNFIDVTDPEFLAGLGAAGADVFFFVEYVPVEEGTGHLALSDSQRREFHARVEAARSRVSSVMIAFPGDESRYGGCLAAGRGFVHVNAVGGVEACPFAPFSDANVQQGGIAGALASPLLSAIREKHHLLAETGSCSLWANKDKFDEIFLPH